jgi:hypothetical protein
MPVLKNPRHELLCQLVPQGAKNGWSQATIYQKAGYRATGHSAEMAASRLMKKDEIRNRINELTAPAARRAGVTTESLLNELETTINDARSDGQHSVVVNALTLSAKLVGLLRDRVEVGTPGSFDACTTEADVVAAFLDGQTVDEALGTLDEMKALIVDYVANHATMIPAAERRRPNEADLSLALHRRRR